MTLDVSTTADRICRRGDIRRGREASCGEGSNADHCYLYACPRSTFRAVIAYVVRAFPLVSSVAQTCNPATTQRVRSVVSVDGNITTGNTVLAMLPLSTASVLCDRPATIVERIPGHRAYRSVFDVLEKDLQSTSVLHNTCFVICVWRENIVCSRTLDTVAQRAQPYLNDLSHFVSTTTLLMSTMLRILRRFLYVGTVPTRLSKACECRNTAGEVVADISIFRRAADPFV